MAAQDSYTAHITRIIEEAPGIRRLQMKVNSTGTFMYKPGQYLVFDLPLTSAVRTRSYTIASNVSSSNELEFVLRNKADGAASRFLFSGTTVGTALKFKGPYGKPFVPPTTDHDVFFICTDVGMGPVRPAVKHLLDLNYPKKIFVVAGNRYANEILFHDEMNGLMQKHDRFSFVPVLSREVWNGERGYVHPVYENLLHQSQSPMFFICGWPRMVNEAKQRLLEKGFTREKIITQIYC